MRFGFLAHGSIQLRKPSRARPSTPKACASRHSIEKIELDAGVSPRLSAMAGPPESHYRSDTCSNNSIGGNRRPRGHNCSAPTHAENAGRHHSSAKPDRHATWNKDDDDPAR